MFKLDSSKGSEAPDINDMPMVRFIARFELREEFLFEYENQLYAM
jgi:hypothetical protein